MKKLFCFCVCLNSIFSDAKESQFIEAINSKLINATITGNPTTNNPLHNSHTGKCLQLTISNISKQPIEIKIDHAVHFINEEKSHQDLINTEDVLVRLIAGETRNIAINALCCEKNDGSPSELDTFQFSKISSPSIQGLCKLLQLKNEYGNIAQQALWCFTDENDLNMIYDTYADTNFENRLVAYIATEKHLPIPSRKYEKIRIIQYAAEVEGKYSQWIDRPTTIGIYITDSLNNPLITIMPDETERRGQGTIKYTYLYRGQLPKGIYFLQAKVDGVWKKEKELVLGQSQ